MAHPPPAERGFSLIELLVALVIVGILAYVGVSMLSGSRLSAVRTVMDQVEATLDQAQKSAVASGEDVVVAINGTWTASGSPSLTGTSPFLMDPRRFQNPTASPAPDAFTGARDGALSERFCSLYAQGAWDHLRAGVATDPAGNALAASLLATAPFTSATGTAFADAFGQLVCTGGQASVCVNGASHRFATGFAIVVVTLAAGTPDPAGPVGVLLVPANSANVFRFFKGEGQSVWRRI